MAKPPKSSQWARLKQAFIGILHLDDTPHSIALGVAIGTFVAYQPIVGAQMIVGAIVFRAIGANVVASLPLAWITNPLTMLPIYYGTYRLGAVFTGSHVSYEEFSQVINEFMQVGAWEAMKSALVLLGDLFWPMVLGGAIVGIVNGALFYVLMLRLVRRYQRHKARESAAS